MIAAPVGVVRSPGPLGRRLRPRNTSRVAGAGMGMMPCAVGAVPPPDGGGRATMRPGASASMSSAAPTMSTTESMEPISWNSTSSGAIPWIRPSAFARRAKHDSASSAARGGSRERESRSRISRHRRCAWPSSGARTSACSARIPATSTSRTSTETPASPRRRRPSSNAARGAPRWRSAATTMSPAIPPTGSRTSVLICCAPPVDAPFPSARRAIGARSMRRRSRR